MITDTETVLPAGWAPPAPPALTEADVTRLRADFPILAQQAYGKPLVYLDNAATTQKPAAVIAAVRRYYEQDNANVHRGVHLLSQRATAAYEGAREKVRRFLNAADAREVVFTTGTTESINLVASTYGRMRLQAGDEIVLSWMEHHSNIVPWQLLCDQTGALLRVIPINDAGELQLEAYERAIGPRTRIVAMTQLSNALGTVVPIRRVIEIAHERGAVVVVDGAQAAPHMRVDVQELDCDFYAFSGHKTYGPTGIGALYGKAELLDSMPPYKGGGEMITSVTFERSTFNAIPHRFEAGTPNIAGAVGLGAALDYLGEIGLDAIAAYESDLVAHAVERLRSIEGLRLIGEAAERASVVSFALDGIHPHDIGTILDREGIAIRAGHHCAQPVMKRFGVPATARASFAFYNTREEVERLVESLDRVQRLFR